MYEGKEMRIFALLRRKQNKGNLSREDLILVVVNTTEAEKILGLDFV
jgi:hypothetical protein